ncbi:hypothetical protein Dda_9471 [Drechslerella dactyloides]|uniref:Uncharacterized protein n=1 Tax=Drechslerella dactyloides TaxID=74499 RepID=A0AAD6NF18_DREDA|nr:hypothetical protein Dda_9471 [Drechslerella dactyloides]
MTQRHNAYVTDSKSIAYEISPPSPFQEKWRNIRHCAPNSHASENAAAGGFAREVLRTTASKRALTLKK